MYKKFNKSGLVIATVVGVAILATALLASSVDFALKGGYVLMAIAALTAIGLPLFFALDNPKSLIRSGISVGVIAVIFGVIYGISSGELLPQYIAQGVSSGQVQFSGAMITMMMVMIGLAIVSVIVTEVYNLFKK